MGRSRNAVSLRDVAEALLMIALIGLIWPSPGTYLPPRPAPQEDRVADKERIALATGVQTSMKGPVCADREARRAG